MQWRWQAVDEKMFTSPEGTFDVTKLSKATLKSLAVQGWQRWMLHNDNRAHCRDVSDTLEPVLDAHAAYFDGACDWMSRWVSIGACPDHRETDDVSGSSKLPCKCGTPAPTRRHWLNECDKAGPVRPHVSEANASLGVTFVKRRLPPKVKGDDKHNRKLLQALQSCNDDVIVMARLSLSNHHDKSIHHPFSTNPHLAL